MSDTQTTPKTLLEALQQALAASIQTADGVAIPAAILWTESDANWLPIMPALRRLMPYTYVLGTYDPALKSGPAIWLKCVVDRTIADVPPLGTVPVLYLPKVPRALLRSAEDCPIELQPLVELVYRGTVWHQRNGRDWTVEAFLEAVLGLDIAKDTSTRKAILHMLPRIAVEPLITLLGHRIDSEALFRLDVEDPVGEVLTWMSDSEAFRQRCDEGRWHSFRQICTKTYGFDPDTDGPAAAGEKLVNDNGATWSSVWRRFCQSPKLYPGLSTVLKNSYADLFVSTGRHPRLNEQAEGELRSGLEAVTDLSHIDACERILALEVEHAERRGTPWAELGESPLALVMQPLSEVARLSRVPIGGINPEAVAVTYADHGWRCDYAALKVMQWATTHREFAPLIYKVLNSIYRPWLDASARHLQSLLTPLGSNVAALSAFLDAEPGTCILFVDGLRFDVACELKERLAALNFKCDIRHRFAPLPTVTPTAKPLAMPIPGKVGPGGSSEDFCPYLSDPTSLATTQRLRQVLGQIGITHIDGQNPHGPASSGQIGWCEIGSLDELGHKLGVGLARQIDLELADLIATVETLNAVGWKQIRIVTDHGWLLLPEGLPKVALPKSVTSAKWARCASVKPGASPDATTFSWYWDSHASIAMPPGIGSYLAGTEYAHGGISPQECVIPDLRIRLGIGTVSAKLVSLAWRGLRIRVTVETSHPGLSVDLRLNRNQPNTTIAVASKELSSTGEASLVVDDESHIGAAAVVVVLDRDGGIIEARTTTVGIDE
ncbi:BREX-1 system phosphatase PglZ type B [Microvirga lotononidis]|uniref:PglZ domain-containing protein n=1 Tax=Microvirga lotononidis TaxID=864069 RepID=I4YVM0_9HYPH|nr:BREX-1 system phosphatase PglZ type B [Microvirga lotononidis]EIM28012.1 hypothetical protein MicloDRAFT_00045890 [Microvirga lotononidis]WQO27873.1 BREX-1 system phosphatase PglZ type B [Microvirga lotononidis]